MGATIRVNGTAHEVASHERAALLWVLRDELGCASARYGCGVEQCGACRVLVDRVPTASCSVTVADVAGREVTTLEGLVAEGRADRVIGAMVDAGAGQCGYCLPGMVTTLTALGERTAGPPSDDDLLRALDEHLCRCGSQPRILRAARVALGLDTGGPDE